MQAKFLRVKAIVKKEFYQIIRDPSSIMISFVMPLFLVFIYGFGVSLDSTHIKVALVAEDSSSEVQSFIQSFKGSPYFISAVESRSDAIKGISIGKYRGFVVLPTYFTKYMKGGFEPAPIQVITDGSETNTSQIAQNYIEGAWSNWTLQQALVRDGISPPLVGFEQRFWYNPELKSRNYLLPGTIALTMTLIGTMLTALVVAREWERGTMEALMATPITAGEFIMGKFIPYFLLGTIGMLICTLLSYFLFGVPMRGSILILLATTSAFLISALGIGLLISTVAKNQFLAYQMAVVIGFLPAFILSGFIFEIKNMPLFIQAITYILPARYFVSSLQTLFLVGNVERLLLYNFLSLAAFGLVMIVLLIRKTKKQLD